MYIHRIHKWWTYGKKLVPGHESEALRNKQKLQMKTFNELAECLARIPPKMTLCGLLFKYNYVRCLQSFMFRSDFLFVIKRDGYVFKETGWFCRFPNLQNQLEMAWWATAVEKWPNFTLKLSTKASSLQFFKTELIKIDLGDKKKKKDQRQIYGLLVNERASAIAQNRSRRNGKKKATERFIHEWRRGRCVIN